MSWLPLLYDCLLIILTHMPSQWRCTPPAATAANKSWEEPAAGIVLRVKSVSRGSAVVSVCRKGGTETVATCVAGVDNNCNGLAGPADPACAVLLRKFKARVRAA